MHVCIEKIIYMFVTSKKRNHEFTNFKCYMKAREPFKTPFKRCIISSLSLTKKHFNTRFFHFKGFKRHFLVSKICELLDLWLHFCDVTYRLLARVSRLDGTNMCTISIMRGWVLVSVVSRQHIEVKQW